MEATAVEAGAGTAGAAAGCCGTRRNASSISASVSPLRCRNSRLETAELERTCSGGMDRRFRHWCCGSGSGSNCLTDQVAPVPWLRALGCDRKATAFCS